MKSKIMGNAIEKLKANLPEVARVFEWADLMGYEDPKKFSEKFLRHYGVRPQKIMELIRLESIIADLRFPQNRFNLRSLACIALPLESREEASIARKVSPRH